MTARPPAARELSTAEEIAEFERLKPRLDALWGALSAREARSPRDIDVSEVEQELRRQGASLRKNLSAVV